MSGKHDYRQLLEQRKGRHQQCKDSCVVAETRRADLTLQLIYHEEAQSIIQQISCLTQEQLTYHVSDLVSLALAAVFEEPYELLIEFVLRRNRTEADLYFVRDGKKIDPMSASGGGAVDVASFALRVALWSLANPRTRNTLILDEPLHFLKGNELPEKGSLMMKSISEKLGLQILMISHIPDQIEGADKVHTVVLRKGVSYVG